MPQQHIDTIPVWEAYHEESECPLCAMEARCESQFLDIALGGALMEPDTRIQTNQQGFCAEHLRLLYARENRLGFALTLHTHLLDYLASLRKHSDALQGQLDAERRKNTLSKAASGMAKASPFYKELEATISHLEQRNGSCYICQRVEKTMDRYVETLLYMYRKEPEFCQAFRDSKGVCLRHYPLLMRGALAHLHGQTRLDFLQDLVALQDKNLQRIADELEWFTLKFDYRNQDKPWGNSKDAVERTLKKLQGHAAFGEGTDKKG